MKKKLLLALIGLSVAGTTLSAQTSVWKITKDRRSVYIGGASHMMRDADFPLPKEFDQAFAVSNQIIFETDPVRLQTPAIQQLITSRGMITDDKTLDKILSPKSWRSIQDFCGMAGIPEDNMNTVRAWRCRNMLLAVEMQKLGVTKKGADAHFYLRTLGTQKTATGLDTAEQHVDYLTNLGNGRESEMIEYTIKESAGLAANHEAVLKAWRTGDLAKIDELLLKDLRQNYPALYRDMYTHRSASWVPKIEALFQSSKPEFILVGVGYLAGPDGLLAKLQQRGLTVEQLKSSDKK